MNDTIAFSHLETWAEKHKTTHDNLPFKSQTAAISLKELKAFIKEAEDNHLRDFDAVKIYFVRYEFKPGVKETQIEKAIKENDLSQVSLVIVPAKITNRAEWTVKELKDKSDDTKILSLCVCNPENDPVKDETGMCPPKGDCPR